MTKNPFDQFSKQFFAEFLAELGEVRLNYEISGEPKFVDIWFIPSSHPPNNPPENSPVFIEKLIFDNCKKKKDIYGE